MRSAPLAAILLTCVAAACANGTSLAEPGSTDDSDNADLGEDQDSEDGPASFMIVIEHGDGWRCSGSLVSLRTALTSAWCARGRRHADAAAADLWALAAAAVAGLPDARLHGARRIVRIAVATGADAEVSDQSEGGGDTWRGGAMDLAVAELERPFGRAAVAVPILMATASEECAPPAACHVAHTGRGRGGRRGVLRIVSAALHKPDTCADAAPHWAAIKDRALCLVGSELCESDWGSGVVCNGKMCGVISRSVRAVGKNASEGAEAAASGCGDTHAAQSTARWRRFLHCAHTLRACGRGGDCAELCLERLLVEETSPPPLDPDSDPGRGPTPTDTTITSQPPSPTTSIRRPRPTRTPRSGRRAAAPAVTRTPRLPQPRAPPALPQLTLVELPQPASTRVAFEFEPNRADFKAEPSRPSPVSVYLKAGEYGDNVAEYGGGGDEAVPTHTSPADASLTPALATAIGAAEERASPPAPERRAAADAGTPTAHHRSAARRLTATITIFSSISFHLTR